jgi:hypothetical protein
MPMFSLQICMGKTVTPCRVGDSSEHNWLLVTEMGPQRRERVRIIVRVVGP